jgi:hypothetical protein
MSYAGARCRVHEPPEAVNTMGRAFDKAVRGLSDQTKTDPNTRQQLAACIMRLFDEGERAPQWPMRLPHQHASSDYNPRCPQLELLPVSSQPAPHLFWQLCEPPAGFRSYTGLTGISQQMD